MEPDSEYLPVGKLPSTLLGTLVGQAPLKDRRIILGPGVGLDCAVVDLSERLLVFKSDPITFTSDELSWYLVQVTVNDIATTGAIPRWLLVTFLLPEKLTERSDVERLFAQLYRACGQYQIDVIGGHTEITHGLPRPIAVGTLIGEIVPPGALVTPKGAKPGDRLLLTKGLAIETTAILAREFPDKLTGVLTSAELSLAQDYINVPGISVLEEARAAVSSGTVNAMHDPTEGGISTALWELAYACNHSLIVYPEKMPVSEITKKICDHFKISPLETISSGALLLVVGVRDCFDVVSAIRSSGVQCTEIGYVENGPIRVSRLENGRQVEMTHPERDALAKVFENDL